MGNKLLIFSFLLLFSSCRSTYPAKSTDLLNGAFEKFDIAGYINKSKNQKGDTHANDFLLKNGTRIERSGNERMGYAEEIIPAEPQFYKIMKTFYPSGNIREKGKMFGNISLGANGVKVGKWYYFDEQGILKAAVDEDKKFGNMGYQEVIALMEKEGMIKQLYEKNRKNLRADFLEESSGKKIWKVEIITAHLSNAYDKGWEYQIDANTGKVLQKRALEIAYVE